MPQITLTNSFLYGVFLLQEASPEVRLWIDSKLDERPSDGVEDVHYEFRVYNPPVSDPEKPPSIFPAALTDKLVGILYKSGFTFVIDDSDAYWVWKFWEK